MPWIDNDDCIGCGICVDKCPTDTITIENNKAIIDMDNCIHCGICHDVCPQGAVEHDSKKIPDEIEANIVKTKEFMYACAKHLGSEDEKQKCLNRMIKHFNKDLRVAKKTLERLEELKE